MLVGIVLIFSFFSLLLVADLYTGLSWAGSNWFQISLVVHVIFCWLNDRRRDSLGGPGRVIFPSVAKIFRGLRIFAGRTIAPAWVQRWITSGPLSKQTVLELLDDWLELSYDCPLDG